MKTKLLLLLLGLIGMKSDCLAARQRESESRVSITFINPEKYKDAGLQRSGSDRANVLRELASSMRRSADAYLPGGYRLDVRVKDIDLAGEFEWWRRSNLDAVRIVRDLYPPRMKLEYHLRNSRGRIVEQGEARLSNQNFLFGAVPMDTDPLKFDKALFRDWLRSEFPSLGKGELRGRILLQPQNSSFEDNPKPDCD